MFDQVGNSGLTHFFRKEIKRGGGVGEFLGHFFNSDGQPIETTLSNRTFTLSRENLKNRRIVAVAGGRLKTRAIRAVLESGYLSGLLTDERTAVELMDGKG